MRAYTKEGVAMETEWASVAGAAGEEEEEKEKGEDLNLFPSRWNFCPIKSLHVKWLDFRKKFHFWK